MPVEELLRDYHMSDAEHCMFVSNLAKTMTRDGAEFALRGVDAAAIADLETPGNEFDVLAFCLNA